MRKPRTPARSSRAAKRKARRHHAIRRSDAMRPSAMRRAAVGAAGQGLVVGDQHQGRAGLGHQVEHQVGHRGGVGGVEVAGGLVGEQQARAGGQGAGQGDPLLLAAGELVRIVPRARAAARPGPASRAPFGGRRASPAISSGAATFSSAVMLGSRWKDWNTSDTRPRRSRARPSSSSAARSSPSRRTRPLRRPLQPGGDRDQRGLAAAGGADDRHPLAGRRPRNRRRAGSPPARPPTAGSGGRARARAAPRARWRRTWIGLAVEATAQAPTT